MSIGPNIELSHLLTGHHRYIMFNLNNKTGILTK